MIKLEIKGLQKAIDALKQFRAWTEDYAITPMSNGEIKIKKKGWLNMNNKDSKKDLVVYYAMMFSGLICLCLGISIGIVFW